MDQSIVSNLTMDGSRSERYLTEHATSVTGRRKHRPRIAERSLIWLCEYYLPILYVHWHWHSNNHETIMEDSQIQGCCTSALWTRAAQRMRVIATAGQSNGV